jgi:hypothetical protein
MAKEDSINFSIKGKELEKLEKWKKNIKGVYGEHGDFDYRFVPTDIGYCVYVYSHLADHEIDLTDYDSW